MSMGRGVVFVLLFLLVFLLVPVIVTADCEDIATHGTFDMYNPVDVKNYYDPFRNDGAWKSDCIERNGQPFLTNEQEVRRTFKLPPAEKPCKVGGVGINGCTANITTYFKLVDDDSLSSDDLIARFYSHNSCKDKDNIYIPFFKPNAGDDTILIDLPPSRTTGGTMGYASFRCPQDTECLQKDPTDTKNGRCWYYEKGALEPVKAFVLRLTNFGTPSLSMETFKTLDEQSADCEFTGSFDIKDYDSSCFEPPYLTKYKYSLFFNTSWESFMHAMVGDNPSEPEYLKYPGRYYLCIGTEAKCEPSALLKQGFPVSFCKGYKSDIAEPFNSLVKIEYEGTTFSYNFLNKSLKEYSEEKGQFISVDLSTSDYMLPGDSCVVPLLEVKPDTSIQACGADRWLGNPNAPTDDFVLPAESYYANNNTPPYCCDISNENIGVINETFSLSLADASSEWADGVGCCYKGRVIEDETLFYEDGSSGNMLQKPSPDYYCSNGRIYKYIYDKNTFRKSLGEPLPSKEDNVFLGGYNPETNLSDLGVLYMFIDFNSVFNNLGVAPISKEKSSFWTSTKGWNSWSADEFVLEGFDDSYSDIGSCSNEGGVLMPGVGCCGDDFNDYLRGSPLSNLSCWNGVLVPDDERVSSSSLSLLSNPSFDDVENASSAPYKNWMFNKASRADIGEAPPAAVININGFIGQRIFLRDIPNQDLVLSYNYYSVDSILPPIFSMNVSLVDLSDNVLLKSHKTKQFSTVSSKSRDIEIKTVKSDLGPFWNFTTLIFPFELMGGGESPIPIKQLVLDVMFKPEEGSKAIVDSVNLYPSYYRNILNYNGSFYVCNPSQVPLEVLSIPITSNVGEDSDSLVVNSETYTSCQPKGSFICSQNTGWSSSLSGIVGTGDDKSLPQDDGFGRNYSAVNRTENLTVERLGYSPSDAESEGLYFSECCAKNSCWDGEQCVPASTDATIITDLAEGRDGSSYRCVLNFTNEFGDYSNAYWTAAEQKLDWNDEPAAYCGDSECALPSADKSPDVVGGVPGENGYLDVDNNEFVAGGCVPNGWADANDHYCALSPGTNNASWTSRSKMLALELLDHVSAQNPNHYTLYCGNYADVANELDYTISFQSVDNTGTESLKSLLSSESVGNVCVLKYENSNDYDQKVLFGVLLDGPFDSSSIPNLISEPVGAEATDRSGFDYISQSTSVQFDDIFSGRFVYCDKALEDSHLSFNKALDPVAKFFGCLGRSDASDDADSFVWANDRLNALIFARKDSGVNLMVQTITFDDWISSPFKTFVNWITKDLLAKNPSDELINITANTKFFSNLYINEYPTRGLLGSSKSILGLVETKGNLADAGFMSIYYKNVDIDCQRLNITGIGKIECQQTPGGVVVRSDVPESRSVLAKKLRLFAVNTRLQE